MVAISNVKEDSVAKRFVFLLAASFSSLLSNAVIMLIIPRVLGPEAFGNYTYLYNFFNKIINFLMGGSSVALFTSLSKRNYDSRVLTFYSPLIFFSVFVVVAFVCIVMLAGLKDLVWPNQHMSYVWLALATAFFIWLISLLQKISDAHALTAPSSILMIYYRVFMVSALLIIFFFVPINLSCYFVFRTGCALLFCCALVWFFVSKQVVTKKIFDLKKVKWKKEWLYFWRFCNPFYVSGLASLIAGILSLWMLQKFSGSIQQGYYGLATGIATICFMFTTSIVSIFTREFSIAHSKTNLYEMQRLFKLYIPLFYAITAFLCVFALMSAAQLIEIVGGTQYKQALTVVMLMSLYPIHQTYGQLIASTYFAMGKTAAYRNVGLVTLTMGLILSYFLLAPKDLFGLHLGAVGAAIQMLAIQIVSTNILAFLWLSHLS